MRGRRASHRPSFLSSSSGSTAYRCPISGRHEEHFISFVAECHSLQQCRIMNKTAERTMNLHVDHASAKHTHAYSRVVMCACCTPLGAVAAGHRRHLSKDGPARVGKRLPQHTLRAVAAPRVRFSTCHARYPPAAIIGSAWCGWLRWHSACTACAGKRLRGRGVFGDEAKPLRQSKPHLLELDFFLGGKRRTDDIT